MTALKLLSDRFFIASIGGAALLLLVMLLLPLGFDNDLYQSMGWALYAYHKLPYIGSWDHNFPGIVFVHWASIALFGSSDFGFRLLDYFIHVAMAGVYFRFLRNWLSPGASLVAVLIFVIYYPSGQWGLAGQRDTYAAFLLLGAASVFVSLRNLGGNGGWKALIVGVLCGSAFMFRPTYIFFSLAFLILLWDVPRRVQTVAAFLAGCALPVIAFLIPYAFIPGGLSQVYDVLIRFNLDVYSSVSVPVKLWTRGRAPIYLFAAVGLVYSFRNWLLPDQRLDRKMFALLAVSAVISPVMMGKYFTYHFEPFMLIAIGFAALGLKCMAELIPIRFLREAAIVLAITLFAFTFYPRHLLWYYFEANGNVGSRLETTYERVLSDSSGGLAVQRQVKKYIDHVAFPIDKVEYVSIFPCLRWRLERPAVSRFTSIVPIIAYTKAPPPYGAEWQKEYLNALAVVAPRYIVISRSTNWWPFVQKTNDSAIHCIPGFDSLLAANYQPDTQIGGFALYHTRK